MGMRVLGWLDTITGRVTMYRLVLSCLGALAVVSLLFSALGVLDYAPVAVIISLAVPLFGSFLSNRLLAAIYGVTPHSESSLISGYLIFFIFPPTTHPLALAGMGLASIFASGSRYVLAFRRRHLFNPAAAGAFLVAVCGIYFSGWWVGTTALLPFTALFAFLILRRTRRLPMAGVFLLAAIAIMVGRSLFQGVAWPTALAWPLTSSPALFFAGFMLSEPLTQPPLRWQQLTVAGLVGVLFSTPLHVGHLYMAPESALLIGNLVAFGFGQRKGIRLTLQRRTKLTPTILEFTFRPTNRLLFRPGQYIEITLPHKNPDARGLRRVFSISSSPTREDAMTVSTKIPDHASTFKQALSELSEGAVVSATAIAGDFLLPADPTQPVLLLAGGIGITPFASQLADVEATAGRDIVVLYTVPGPDEISYVDVLERSNACVVLISGHAIDQVPPGWTAIHESRLDEKLLLDLVPDVQDRHVFISGPPPMVAGLESAVRHLGAADVHTDYFSGY